MSLRMVKGRGRLVPTRATGIAYKVRYGIHLVSDEAKGKGVASKHWAKCSVQLDSAGRVPDGSYFLYTEEGQIHQLRTVEGKWQFLSQAA